jgi:hypothetical protein
VHVSYCAGHTVCTIISGDNNISVIVDANNNGVTTGAAVVHGLTDVRLDDNRCMVTAIHTGTVSSITTSAPLVIPLYTIVSIANITSTDTTTS